VLFEAASLLMILIVCAVHGGANGPRKKEAGQWAFASRAVCKKGTAA
jgi:hypothetical protein